MASEAKGPTPEEAVAMAVAMSNAKMLLLALSPKDALCAAVYAYELCADLQAPEGQKLMPLLVAMRDASQKVVDSLSAVPEEDLNPSDDGLWAEDFVEAFAKFGPMAPGSLMSIAEVVLHYLAGAVVADNPLQLPPLTVPADVKALAAHILAAYRKVMRAKMAQLGMK